MQDVTMADDMGSGTEVQRAYQDAIQAQLGERVTNLGRRQNDMETEMRSGFKQMETAVSGLANEMRTSVASLSTNIAERNRPQWQAIGVTLTFCAMIGGLVYWPINASTIRLENSIASIADKMVTQKELEWRTARGQEDRKRTDDAIIDLRGAAVSRNEWSERNHARDNEIAEIRRRLDEIRQDVGSQYTTRDVLLSTQAEVKDLRNQLRALYQSGTRPVGSIP